jgi:hypothetical protein
MAYTELQKRGKKNYFYLVHTIRIDSKFKKLRVFLGVDLDADKMNLPALKGGVSCEKFLLT